MGGAGGLQEVTVVWTDPISGLRTYKNEFYVDRGMSWEVGRRAQNMLARRCLCGAGTQVPLCGAGTQVPLCGACVVLVRRCLCGACVVPVWCWHAGAFVWCTDLMSGEINVT